MAGIPYQWCCASSAWGTGSILTGELESCMHRVAKESKQDKMGKMLTSMNLGEGYMEILYIILANFL